MELERDLFSFKHRDAIKLAVIQKLTKEGLTSASTLSEEQELKVDKKKKKVSDKVFGLSLECDDQERTVTECRGRPSYLPKFFVEAIRFLESHVKCEGIFRKAGSLSRQKFLKMSLNERQSLPAGSNPYDIAALLKQYLRELPQPLLTTRLSTVFVECVKLFSENKELLSQTILQTCLLLPTQHLLCLQILMQLLHKVSIHCESNSMDSQSLAVVMAPNILPCHYDGGRGREMKNVGIDVKNMTCIVQVLIDNTHMIGKVPKDISELSKILQEGFSDVKFDKKRKHHRRESVSELLRGKFNKLRNKKEGSPSIGYENLLDSPNRFAPISKRPALDISNASSERGGVASNGTSPALINERCKRKMKRRYTVMGKAPEKYAQKVYHRFPLLSNDDVSVNSLTTPTSLANEKGLPYQLPGVGVTIEHGGDCSSTYKLVSQTRRTYPKTHQSGGCIITSNVSKDTGPNPITYKDKPIKMGGANDLEGASIGSRVHMRKRKQGTITQSTSSGHLHNSSTKHSLPISQSDFVISGKCAHVTEATPVNERPTKRVRRRTDEHLTSYKRDLLKVGCAKPCSGKDAFTSKTDSVCNNESYLCAIGEPRDVLRQIDNHSPDHTPQAYPLIKSSGRSTIKRAHTIAVKSPFPITPSSWRQRQESSARNGQLSKRAQKYIVSSGNRQSINTARSPWVNRRGIQVSEWIL